ncbi:DUF480 domain-containing protein [Nocardioides sp. cx-173]|uniref:DUF480 domain-containing protein n=1 Tax=Nocardioides sp. cx-173 TaxID=2898796 RepID=UPI001E41F6F3|nr:DUF480 domain-containing protein [Nocardioides sp. cx-173]MCD4525184.1 DUF480 domain-containing protein [Nocardioides sp. cx-173]UGB40119.1 DUF480 domain-containing protein [Nocardioides sp. cx-173]
MSELPDLDPTEQRILGALLEKERTVPASYPLSLNALRTACNQTSSRDPITDYDEATVERVARELKDRGLVRIVWAPTGRRTLKYHETLAETLSLTDAERALVTVLLLRGRQAPGELRSRTERLHAFADREAVEETLRRMAARPTPLVRELERRPGQHDNRWVHLLGPVEAGSTAPSAAATADLDVVLAEGGEARDQRVRTSYAALAETYAEQLSDDLARLPFERWLLDRVASEAGDQPVVEVGCGPGDVTAYLADAGVEAWGLDLTPEMVEQARRRYPEGRYDVGDLRRLMRPATGDGWGAVLAWYSLIHLAPSELTEAVGALARPMRPGGRLMLAMQAGPAVRHLDSWLDVEVSLDFVMHDPAHVRSAVEAAGLVDLEWYLRGPLAWRGEITERFYLLATKPA